MLQPRIQRLILVICIFLINTVSSVIQGSGSNHNPLIITKTIPERDDPVEVVDLEQALKLTSKRGKISDLRAIIASGTAKHFLGLRGTRTKIFIDQPLNREKECPQQQQDWLVALKRENDKLKQNFSRQKQRNGFADSFNRVSTEDLLNQGIIEECIKSAIIMVSYKESGQKRSTQVMVDLQITIQDVNTNVPQFQDEERTIKISENAQIDTRITLSSANDADLPPNHVQRYYMKGSQKTKNYFSIETDENKLDGTLVPILRLNKELDREDTEKFTFKLFAEDGFQNQGAAVPGKGSMTINIQVLDENDNAPVFKRTDPVITVDETEAIGAIIYTAVATDKDSAENNQITYWSELLIIEIFCRVTEPIKFFQSLANPFSFACTRTYFFRRSKNLQYRS